MADDLFEGLPPPSAPARHSSPPSAPAPPPPPAPPLKSALKRKQPPSDSTDQVKDPALKSALKRDKPSASFSVSASPDSNEEATTNKRLRFRTSTDQTSQEITEAMRKIASHIKNPSKFIKASKLAVHLMQTGSVKKEMSEDLFAILEGAMGDLANCNAPSVRKDYCELFTAAQDATEYFSKKQKNQLAIWTFHAVVANDLQTDDSFVFSKTVTKIKEAILNLPPATPEEDKEESESLSITNQENQEIQVNQENRENSAASSALIDKEALSDPFGLDDLFSEKGKINEKGRSKKEEEEEAKRFLKAQREALLKCLEIAAKRYKIPWTQTTIDILAKHAIDHVDRFTKKQREAIESLWGSIKEQQIRRKQGKSITGKLDVNRFEWLQEKYSNEKISIRRAVGGGGGRHCEQWLG